MADQPEVSVVSQTTPGHTALTNTAGARSVYDPGVVSAQARDAAVDQMLSSAAAMGAGVVGVGGVTRVTQQNAAGFPVTFHTAAYSVELPIAGQ
jgi:uncharacterized protein YbjQ (UPF0145 family)